MDNYKLISKSSTIGLVLKIVGVIFIISQVFKIVEKFIGENSFVFWLLVLAAISYLFYSYFTDKTIFSIENKEITIQISKGFPKKKETYTFCLDEISKINLIQTHNKVYGGKFIELINIHEEKQVIDFNVRYYQLVQLEAYLNDNSEIEANLIG